MGSIGKIMKFVKIKLKNLGNLSTIAKRHIHHDIAKETSKLILFSSTNIILVVAFYLSISSVAYFIGYNIKEDFPEIKKIIELLKLDEKNKINNTNSQNQKLDNVSESKSIVESSFPQNYFTININWLNYSVIFCSIYAMISYFLAKIFGEYSNFFTIIFRVPSWLELKSFGEQKIARFSYLIIVITPMIAYFVIENPFKVDNFYNIRMPVSLKITYFASFSLSLALLVFSIGCPKEIHQKNSFGDSRVTNIILLSSENSMVNLRENESIIDNEIDHSKIGIRTLCLMLYSISLILSTILLIRSAIVVFNA